MTSRVYLAGTWFNTHKILSAKFRPAYLWFRYPYVLDLIYKEPRTEWIPIVTSTGKITTTTLIPVYHDTTDYKFKYRTLYILRNDVLNLREAGIQCIVDIDEKTLPHFKPKK